MRKMRATLLGLLTVATVSSCAVRPLDLPLPGTQYGKPTYQVRVEFGNVLTLPLKTRVELNGAQVGVVESVSVRPVPDAHVPELPADRQPYYQPTAVLAIDRDVRLPAETTVEMAQATLFGDAFVKLTIPQRNSGRVLSQGGVIPVTQTKQAINVEEYMTAVVSWVTGGSIPFATSFVTSVNQAFPADSEDFRDFMSKTVLAVNRIGETTAQLSVILDNATAVIDTIGQAEDVWRFLFDDVPVLLGVVQRVLPDFVYFIDAIRRAAGLAYDHLVDPANPQAGPRVESAHRFLDVWTPLAQALIASPTQLPRTLDSTAALLGNKIVPFLSARGRIEITDVVPQTPAAVLTGDPEADARIIAANERAFRDRVRPVLALVGLVR
ncbi:MCE family protein [Nocardia uniformis]|uniref:MCE family protein n=1 Tax=Nocardia uniformis TaxID=53432 RepID=A0A849C3F1_9NOCA|nr:MlaD family protein [Nocardia uniformis]NNH70970.1 MCE family protein [Nocardia uniformis]